MRKHFLTTVAALAIATPVLAAGHQADMRVTDDNFAASDSGSAVAGDIEFNFGLNWVQDDKGRDLDLNTFQGWGRANIPVGGTWNLLVEAGGGAAFGGDYPSGASNSDYGANAHLWVGMNGVRVGAFGGASFGESVFPYPASHTWGQAGLEAEVDLGNATLGLQGFYSWQTGDCLYGDCNLYGANAWLDYYITADTKVTGTLQWLHTSDFNCQGFCDGEIYGGSARITHRFAGTPLNIFGEAGYWTGGGPFADIDYASVSGGLTIMFGRGAGTQQEYDSRVPFTFRNPVSTMSRMTPLFIP